MKIRTASERKTFTYTQGEESFDFVLRKTNTNDAIELQSVFQKREFVVADQDGERTVRSEYNPQVANRKAAYLSLAEVINLTDEAGNDLFRTSATPLEGKRVFNAMDEEDFNRVWGVLDPEATDFIITCIREFNPGFLS